MVGKAAIDIWEDIESIEEREAEIKRKLESLKKEKKRKTSKDRKGRIILIINTTVKALF